MIGSDLHAKGQALITKTNANRQSRMSAKIESCHCRRRGELCYCIAIFKERRRRHRSSTDNRIVGTHRSVELFGKDAPPALRVDIVRGRDCDATHHLAAKTLAQDVVFLAEDAAMRRVR